MPIVLVLLEDGVRAEFRGRPDEAGRMGAIRVERRDLATLADYLDRRFGLDGTGTVEARIEAAIRAMADRGEIQERYRSNPDHVATYCARAGIRYERVWFDGQRWRVTQRRVPLFSEVEPNGMLRTVSVQLQALGGERAGSGFSLDEDFSDPRQAHPEDIYSGYSHELSVGYEAFGPVAGLIEERFGLPGAELPDDRAEALLTGLVARGELGAHLPPGENRERLAGWCREADVRPRWGGRNRRHEILRTDRGLVLEVSFWPVFWPPPVIRFTEAHRVGDLRFGGTQYEVTAPFEALPVLADAFERRLGLTAGPGRVEDRLIAGFTALAAQGHLHGGRPRQGNRAVVAEWIAAAGVTPTLRGFARTERLLRVHRAATDCIYELVLTMDAAAGDGAGVRFAEHYEYLPRAGDPGREYTYAVKAPYSALDALVNRFEEEPGEGDLEERLTRGFTALVARGKLRGDLELREARDLVTAWFGEAGVAAVTDDSHWFNSE